MQQERRYYIPVTDMDPMFNGIESDIGENICRFLEVVWRRYPQECQKTIEDLQSKYFLSNSEEDRLKLKIAAAFLVARESYKFPDYSFILHLEKYLWKYSNKFDFKVHREACIALLTSTLGIVIQEKNNVAQEGDESEDDDDYFDMDTVDITLEAYSEPDYDGEHDFDNEHDFEAEEYGKFLMAFATPSNLSNIVNTYITASNELDPEGTGIARFGMESTGLADLVTNWHLPDPVDELAQVISMQHILLEIESIRDGVMYSFVEYNETVDDEDPIVTYDDLVVSIGELRDQLVNWIMELTQLDEEYCFEILQQLFTKNTIHINYFNLFIHAVMSKCIVEDGESRPDYLISRLEEFGFTDPNLYSTEMRLDLYPVAYSEDQLYEY